MVSHSVTMGCEIDLERHYMALLGAIFSNESPDRVMAIMGIKQPKTYPNRPSQRKDISLDEILALRSQGLSNVKIAARLGVSPTTVFRHLEDAGLTRRLK